MPRKHSQHGKQVSHGTGEKEDQEVVSRPALPGKPPFAGGVAKEYSAGEDAQGGDTGAGNAPKKNTFELEIPEGSIHLENYCPTEKLEGLAVDEGIRMFSRHNPERQKKALVNVAKLEGGNIIAGIKDGVLVSYIGLHHPSERERWGKPGYPWLFELGAIEVSRNYRELGLAGTMLDIGFDDPFYDDKVVLTTAFTWHWDLEGTGMDKMRYRELFLHLAAKHGFVEMGTDEPNVTMDSANLFLVRLGKEVSFSKYQAFASILYADDWEAMLRGF
jgi:acetoin utilization protein AcuA